MYVLLRGKVGLQKCRERFFWKYFCKRCTFLTASDCHKGVGNLTLGTTLSYNSFIVIPKTIGFTFFFSSISCSILHPTRRPTIHPIPSNPLIAQAATSVSDGIFITGAGHNHHHHQCQILIIRPYCVSYKCFPTEPGWRQPPPPIVLLMMMIMMTMVIMIMIMIMMIMTMKMILIKS